MHSARQIDALILAGGQGLRLGGQDKGLLTAGEDSFASSLATLLRPYCRQLIINCNRHQDYYQTLADRIVTDLHPGHQGPLAGLYAAAQASDADFLLVTPCDTPALDKRFPQRMLANASAHQLLVAHDGKRLQHLHLLAPRQALLGLQQLLEQDLYSVKDWLAQTPFTPIDFSDCPHLFLNVNTDEDLQLWRQAQSGRRS